MTALQILGEGVVRVMSILNIPQSLCISTFQPSYGEDDRKKKYLGLWETLHNPNFNPLEFEGFRKEAGLNAFTLSPTRL